ncbi:MAG: LysE family transporter [Deltaproteobacteria bacterium]|nr:LysE family transporter [Deltaproteobacteria bacterium]
MHGELEIYLKGFAVGLLPCAPLGPVGVLCARRFVLDGRRAGVLSMLGASTADALWCCLACLGLRLTGLLRMNQTLITLSAGLFLMALGVWLFFNRSGPERQGAMRAALLRSYVSTFLVMLANPMPIVLLAAALAASGIHTSGLEGPKAALAVAGVTSGSMSWTPLFLAGSGLFRRHLKSQTGRNLNRITGTLIFGFGVGSEIHAMMG